MIIIITIIYNIKTIRSYTRIIRISFINFPLTVQISAQETALNEITNKVFNELMQKKTDLQSKNLEISQSSSLYANQQPYHQHSQQQKQQQYVPSQQEDVSGRSDDWCSESSSGNVRQLGQQQSKNRSIISIGKPRKFSLTPSISNVSILTSNSSKDNSTSSRTITEEGSTVPLNGATYDEVNKKPLIAKWKTGVRLQNATSPSTDGKGGQINVFFVLNSCFELQLILHFDSQISWRV